MHAAIVMQHDSCSLLNDSCSLLKENTIVHSNFDTSSVDVPSFWHLVNCSACAILTGGAPGDQRKQLGTLRHD